MSLTKLLGGNEIGTLFHENQLHYFNWKTQTLDGAAQPLSSLSLPTGFEKVTAACVHPLDREVVWLFNGSKVVDYHVELGRPMVRGRAADDGTIATEVATKIEDHPVFGVLPASFHGGIVGACAVFIDGKAHVVVWTAGALVYLRLTSLNRALPGEPTAAGTMSRGLNGANVNAERIYWLDDGDDCTIRGPGSSTVKEPWAKVFKTFKPDAGVPVKLVRKSSSSVNTPPSPQKADGTPDASGPSATANIATDLPPDVLVAIPGRGAFRQVGATIAFLSDGGAVPPCTGSEAEREKQLQDRNRVLAARLAKGVDIPDFLRVFVSITLPTPLPSARSVDPVTAQKNEKIAESLGLEMRVFVAPDYLAIGSDLDWCRITLSALAGQHVLDRFGCMYPTRRIALEVFDQTPKSQRVKIQGKGTGEMAVSTRWTIEFHQEIESPRRILPGRSQEQPLGRLVASPMKDIIIGHTVLGAAKKNPRTTDTIHFWADTGAKRHGFGADFGTTVSDHRFEKHNEYAMGVRMVYKTAYVRRPGGAWKQAAIPDLLSGKNLPADFPELKDAFKLLTSIFDAPGVNHEDYRIDDARYKTYKSGW